MVTRSLTVVFTVRDEGRLLKQLEGFKPSGKGDEPEDEPMLRVRVNSLFDDVVISVSEVSKVYEL